MTADPTTLGRESTLLELYENMLLIRRFEEKVRELRLDGQIQGSVHLCIGQEAIYSGGVAAIRDVDAVFATYRGHGWALACGAGPTELFAELLGRAGGVNGGRGGSAYFTAPDHRFYGENSIVGGSAPIALGAALAGRFDGSGRVAVVAFGEGAMNQGAVHEAMNFASAMSLPVVFVIENNRYSELTPTRDMVGQDRLFRRASGYGMTGVRINGNDPLSVREHIAAAVDKAAHGEGPSLVEAMTERLVGHYIGDAEQYRPAGEVESAKDREPLVVARRHLQTVGVELSRIETVETNVMERIATASDAALRQPPVDPTTVREHVYA